MVVGGDDDDGFSRPVVGDQGMDLEGDGQEDSRGRRREPGGIPDIPDVIPEQGRWRRPRRFAVRDRRRRFNVPREPTQQEREDHMLTHTPPEDWCEYCAGGKGLCQGHRVIKEEDKVGSMPTVSMDLAFIRRRGEDGTLPLLVVRENLRGETRSHALLSKHVDASQGSHAIKSVVSDIECMGFKNIILNSGQEPVMRALQLQVKKRWAGEVVPRHSAVGQSASNGFVERQYMRLKHS